MDKLRKVTGKWRGIYAYEPIEKMPKLEPVPFILNLKQGWFGHFTGTVTEDASKGTPGIGNIDGYFSFPRVEFTKRMPIGYIIRPDGRRFTLREYLIEHGHTRDNDLPGYPIYYEGEFSGASRAEGIWIIRAGPFPIGNGKVINMSGTKGTWNIDAA